MASPNATATTPAQQALQAYYAQRAAIYERIYHKPERHADLRAMESELAIHFRGRRVLEVAAGTGWWTAHGARGAQDWLATDINPEPLLLARSKPLPACVRFGLLDVMNWAAPISAAPPPAASDAYGTPFTPMALPLAAEQHPPFDAAFAGFWWSHLPRDTLPSWLQALHARLQPGAQVLFLDNRFVPGSSTPISRRDAQCNSYQLRALDDGSRHEVLKNFPTRDEAAAALGPGVGKLRWVEFEHYWVLSYTTPEPARG